MFIKNNAPVTIYVAEKKELRTIKSGESMIFSDMSILHIFSEIGSIVLVDDGYDFHKLLTTFGNLKLKSNSRHLEFKDNGLCKHHESYSIFSD